MNITLIILYILWNILTFTFMGIDKKKAIEKKNRISEKFLLLNALLFGALGETLGALLFHHKTKKKKFQILLPLFLAINLITIYFIYLYY